MVKKNLAYYHTTSYSSPIDSVATYFYKQILSQ